MFHTRNNHIHSGSHLEEVYRATGITEVDCATGSIYIWKTLGQIDITFPYNDIHTISLPELGKTHSDQDIADPHNLCYSLQLGIL